MSYQCLSEAASSAEICPSLSVCLSSPPAPGLTIFLSLLPPRSRSRKELVSEKWWVICCWYWRGECWGSGDSSSESGSVKRDASVCHSHVHHKRSLHTHTHTCTVFPLFCCSFYHSVCLSVTLSIHPSFCHLSFHLSILLTSFILSIHTSIFISFYPSTHP